MAQETNIEWCDLSWNPTLGCSKVSAGCSHCYAETIALRFGMTPKPWTERNAAENVLLKPHKLREPLSNAKAWRGCGVAAAAAGKTEGKLVFTNSMSDLFHEQISDEYILAVWAVMEASPQHTFQILTKRPERMRLLLGAERPAAPPAPPYERRPIPGYNGYWVDTVGDVWSSKRSADLRVMAPDVGEQGHRRVMLYHSGGHDRRLVHRLVLTAFDRAPAENEQACHRDGNSANNAIENLYWGSQGDNWADRNRHGNGRSYSKMTAGQVADLRIAAIQGESAYALGKRFGISDTQARNIIRGNQWGFKTLVNCWLGVSIENRKWVGRADVLRETPAAVRFISAEPLLGPLTFDSEIGSEVGAQVIYSGPHDGRWRDDYEGPELDLTGIDWLVVGGESGPGHRPMALEWARNLRVAADATRIGGERPDCAFFMKQIGGAQPGTALEDLPEDLRIREFPSVTA